MVDLLGDGAEGLGYLLKERVADPGPPGGRSLQCGDRPGAVAVGVVGGQGQQHAFAKLGLTGEPTVHRRVSAVVTYLRAVGHSDTSAPTHRHAAE